MNKAMGLQAYNQRLGHDIDGVRPVMIPSDDGVWFSRSEVELALRSNGMMQLSNKLEAAERERDERRQQFDKLASAAGWSKERCEQVGDSPFDVVEELVAAKCERDNWRVSFDNERLRADKLRDELARRDAVAGEPVGYLFTSSEGNVVYSPCPWSVEGLTLQGPVYAAAPPAISTEGLDPESREVMVGDIPAIILGIGMLIGIALCLKEM